MIGEILSTLNVIEKIGRFLTWARKARAPATETVAGRFIFLFESHDVHRNQIPRFFGQGLSLRDVQDEASLLDKLDEPMLEAACRLFAVRREWLEGAERQIYQCHDFYKHPAAIAPFFEALKASNPDGQLDGVLIAPDDLKGDALIVLHEVVGWIGDKPIYRHHVLNNWLFNYWKSRAYLTACVAIAWKSEVFLRGFYASTREIKRIACGEALLGSNGEQPSSHRPGPLYPEDMAIKPDSFLAGIDPEENKYGITSALELWLELDEGGYRAAGLSMYEPGKVRSSFEQALAEQRSMNTSPP